jgi:hypothetical protein
MEGARGGALLRVSHVLLLSAEEPVGTEMLEEVEDPTPFTTVGTLTLGTPGTTLLLLGLELPVTLPLGALTPLPIPATAPTLVTGPMLPTAYVDAEEEDGSRLRTCASSSAEQTRRVNCGAGGQEGSGIRGGPRSYLIAIGIRCRGYSGNCQIQRTLLETEGIKCKFGVSYAVETLHTSVRILFVRRKFLENGTIFLM